MGLNGTKDQDKEWSAVSMDGSTLLTCWTQFDLYGSPLETDQSVILCSTSNRRAKKWSEPVRVNAIAGDCADGDLTVEGAVPDIALDGTMYVAWAHADTIWMDRSADGGETWVKSATNSDRSISGGTQLADGRIVLAGLSGSVLVSEDSGKSFTATVRSDRKSFATASSGPDDTVLLYGDPGILSHALSN